MKKFKLTFQKGILFCLVLLMIFSVTSCKKHEDTPKDDVKITLESDKYTLQKTDVAKLTVTVTGSTDTTYSWMYDTSLLNIDANNQLKVIGDYSTKRTVEIKVVANADKTKSATISITLNVTPIKPPVKDNISVGIKGSSEVKSGKTINLEAVVTGSDNQTVLWEVKSGSEFATIDSEGRLTASKVSGDKVIEVTATSLADTSVVTTKVITIVAKPELTQEMLDALNVDTIGFEGYININLYTIGIYSKLHSTHITVVKTAMDGTNWYAEYLNGDTNTQMGLYYRNHDQKACQVSVSFMNEEQYTPMQADDGSSVSWEDAGLYNNLKGLKLSDFQFNEKTWRYEYVGSDERLDEKIVASANPYDFIADGFSLIIEDGEILGIYAKSKDDYSIAVGYKAIQELIVAINFDETVDVKRITKFSHENGVHDELAEAIANMRALKSYTLDFKSIIASYMYTGLVQSGYTEYVTQNDCYFLPYSVTYDKKGNEIHNYQENADYGYHKINDNLYNTFFTDKAGGYNATRAYQTDFSAAKPTFAFAAEIFRSYYINAKDGTTTYYVDNVMSSVASTFYYGVGNDENLYGLFATEGRISSTETFTPYVVVKDGYIIEAAFYFYVGSMYGVVEVKYSDFNETEIPQDVNIDFTPRQVPTSWSELTVNVSSDGPSTVDDEEVNALEYFKTFYGNDNIDNELPFFGNVLGDTYGFGLTTIYTPGGTSNAELSVVLYYDVPLGLDYTIDAPLKDIKDYLVSLGFVENKYGEFNKDNIWISPQDSNLDLVIYVWKK